MNQVKGEQPVNTDSLTGADLAKMLEIITKIRYGSVTLIIQDGRVVQIDKNEKVRLK